MLDGRLLEIPLEVAGQHAFDPGVKVAKVAYNGWTDPPQVRRSARPLLCTSAWTASRSTDAVPKNG
jgi:hypothetical protein